MPTINRRSFMLGTGALGLAGALAACDSGSGSTPGGGSTTASNAVELPNYVPFEQVEPDLPGVPGRSTPAWFSYPSSPLTLHADAPGDGAEFTALTIAEAVPTPLGDNQYWQTLNELLGSPYAPVLTPAADYKNKFATMTAGDELPDFYIALPDAPALSQLLEARAVDLTPYLAGSAIEAYPGLANIPTDSWRAAVYAGGIRGLPISRGFSTGRIMYKRVDTLEQLGLAEDPTSIEEWISMMEEMTNPAASVWALGSLPHQFIRQSLQIPNGWEIVDGAFVSAYEHEAQEQALETARQIWDAGLINPDTAAVPNTKQREWVLSGTVMMCWETISSWSLMGDGDGTDPNYVGNGIIPPGFDGGTSTPHFGYPNHSIIAINSDSEDRIETLLGIADWFASPFGTAEWLFKTYGIEGVHYDMVDGTPALTDVAPERLLGQNYVAAAARVQFSPNRASTQRMSDFEYAWTENAIGDPSVGLYSETSSRQLAALVTAIEAAEVDIVTGRAPVSSWSDAVASFLSGGGDAIKDELSEAYAANS